MMKWKVVKNPRCSSAESLECMKNDVAPTAKSDSTNNNEPEKQDPGTTKENTKQQESGLTRKPSIVASDCINLKSFLGLTRQRSEINLSTLGLINTEPRRSRSEVRGTSCDRLAIGYHTAPLKTAENGKTRSSSPPPKSGGWLRGRKRERESRNPLKNNLEVFGKTIVTGSGNKRTNSKSRTIVDGSDGSKPKESPSNRKSKSNKKNCDENTIIEDVIYSEIGNDNVQAKLLDENRDVYKEPIKVVKKKGMAPKPQTATALFKETNRDVNLNPNGIKANGHISCFDEKSLPPFSKPPRKGQTCKGRNQEKKYDNRNSQTVKYNNQKNSETALLNSKNKANSSKALATVAEIHKDSIYASSDHETKKRNLDHNKKEEASSENVVNEPLENSSLSQTLDKEKVEEQTEPFYIDTPDYSTLDSENGNGKCLSLEESFTHNDLKNTNTELENQKNSDNKPADSILLPVNSEDSKPDREISLSSILRDSTNDSKHSDAEPKKVVRFEKLDLIEKYKRNKAESNKDTEDDTESSICDDQPLTKYKLDVNSNEILPSDLNNSIEDSTKSSEKLNTDNRGSLESPKQPPPISAAQQELSQNGTSILVRNCSPVVPLTDSVPSTPTTDAQTQFVVKKSFVITIAKQEKGFKSLCANKKSEINNFDQSKNDHQISVTFLCSGPSSESWVDGTQENIIRLRSMSVPPQRQEEPEILTELPSIRGRSRERRSKERQYCKKNHKLRKKDAAFHMPQVVIDELSQVLEKRKPFLDEVKA
ncbi:uncharacterized protein LOC118197364 isoform X2 [Stegodyphus dumicola]|uniref:uncharacterized protein LOC118197364 isoform X2 n=1 Tax=Stegodyphus dumicola TaxID=202533 RepID=UPI0015AE9678|nr:uncharacterized protein LOC118197364 isoform X2 [Stegodyphus dumicola]